MSAAFSLYDLFTLGGGLELGGGALIVYGTVSSPADLVRQTVFWGSAPVRVVAVARGRLDAITGFLGLLLGFIVQSTGYALYLAHRRTTSYGGMRALIAAVVAVVAAGLWFWVGQRITRRRTKQLLVTMARQTFEGDVLELPRAEMLAQWGPKGLSEPAAADEDLPAYLLRVFRVQRSCLHTGDRNFVPLENVPRDDWPKLDD